MIELKKDILFVAKFICDNHDRIKERHFVCGDLFIFAEFLTIF